MTIKDTLTVLFVSTLVLIFVVIPIIAISREEWGDHKKKKARAIVSEHLKLLCDDKGNLIEYEEAMIKLAELGIEDKIDIIMYNSMRADMRYEYKMRGY